MVAMFSLINLNQLNSKFMYEQCGGPGPHYVIGIHIFWLDLFSETAITNVGNYLVFIVLEKER